MLYQYCRGSNTTCELEGRKVFVGRHELLNWRKPGVCGSLDRIGKVQKGKRCAVAYPRDLDLLHASEIQQQF